MRSTWLPVLLSACNFHGSATWTPFGGPSRAPAPAPAATPEAPPADVVVDPPAEAPVALARNDRPAADTEQVGTVTPPTGKPVTRAWDGKYVMWPGATCSGATPFKPGGPDEQTAPSDGWNGSAGWQCPGSCTDPTPVVVANGVATFPATWLDDSPQRNSKRGYQLAFHRTKVSIPLAQLPGDVGALRVDAMPARAWSYDRRDHTSNQVAVSIVAAEYNSDADGHGRVISVGLYVGHDGKFFLDDRAPNCTATLARTDYKPPVETGGDDDGDGGDDGAAPSSSREDARAATAARKCKSQCRSDAGACRRSCKGAKCANDCNHAEQSCTRSC